MTGTANEGNIMQGRGAWTERGKGNGTIYYCLQADEPLDGTEPEVMPEDPLGIEETSDPDWYDRAHRGVLGLQRLLRLNGVPEVPLNGIFEAKTDLAVKRFQHQYPERVGAADGLVGPKTMKALCHMVLLSAGLAEEINPKWLYGQICKETQFDPGAQGQLNAPDSGICQFNLMAGTDNKITQKELSFAYNPVRAINASMQRFASAWDDYKGKGLALRIDCSIAQHNSPLWANQWFASGEAPNDTIAEYVADVRDYAIEWEWI
jgi:hypothetical protein